MDISFKSPKWGRIFLIISIGLGFLISVSVNFMPEAKKAEVEFDMGEKLAISQGNSLLPASNPSDPEPRIVGKLPVVVTAYSSTPWETDDTPYITAAGTWVRDGIVANNMYPFGTKIRMPEIYGDKIFVVEDRMSWKKSNYHIDIWLSSNWEAKNFGVKETYIEVLEN